MYMIDQITKLITILRALGSAPCSISSITHGKWPPADARINGVVESYKLQMQMDS